MYTGEPIFNGKFRTIPGPRFWILAYLFLDLGSIFPYLAANAATPVATLLKGGVVPNPAADSGDFWLMKVLAYLIFLLAMVPMLFGGKMLEGRATGVGEIRGTAIEGGKRYPMAAGDSLYIPINVPHQFLVEPGQHLVTVIVKTVSR